MKDEKLYLIHILESITRIEEYVADGKSFFMESTLIQDAVMRNLQTIGESVQMLSEETKRSYPQVDWRGIVGFRNVIVHQYLGVTLDLVWEVVEKDLPLLKLQVATIVDDLETDI